MKKADKTGELFSQRNHWRGSGVVGGEWSKGGWNWPTWALRSVSSFPYPPLQAGGILHTGRPWFTGKGNRDEYRNIHDIGPCPSKNENECTWKSKTSLYLAIKWRTTQREEEGSELVKKEMEHYFWINNIKEITGQPYGRPTKPISGGFWYHWGQGEKKERTKKIKILIQEIFEAGKRTQKTSGSTSSVVSKVN